MMALIDGCFYKYLVNEEKTSFMTREVLELHKELREVANSVDTMCYLGERIYSDYLIWMMNVIEYLLLHPEKMSVAATDLG